MRNTFLVTYDIGEDRRLAKVHKTMRGFGDHLQYSVFECQLTRADLARCRHLLSTIIDHRGDQVLFVDPDRKLFGLCLAVRRDPFVRRGLLTSASTRQLVEPFGQLFTRFG